MKLENEIHGENIRSIFERNKCDPKKFNIAFCSYYDTDECKYTCEYAVKKEKWKESSWKELQKKI